MEQIVEKITQDLLEKLPDQAQSYSPDELLSFGIPYIVVETVRKNIVSTVDSELRMPESPWIKLNHENVQTAWNNFVEISRQHLQIPGSKLSYLLTEAVEQCLELAVKPRQSVPEIIFRTRDTIDLKTAKERVVSIEVNKQLALALLRYMEKKEKDEVTFEQACDLIKKVDQRLIEDFHPLKWAQALKPVFDLAGPSVDAELFRIFFEDKEKPAYARKFELLDEPLNESEFIETLSSADVLDVEGYEDGEPELFAPVEKETEPEKVVEIDEMPDEEKATLTDEVDESEETAEEDVEIPDEDVKDVDEPIDEASFEPDQTEHYDKPEYTNLEIVDEDDSDDQFSEDEIESEDEDNQKENIINLFSKISDAELFEKEEKVDPVISLVEENEDHDDDDNITLLSKFIFDESKDQPIESADEELESPESTPKHEPSSIYEEMNLVQDDGRNRQNKNQVLDQTEETDENEEVKVEEEELSFKIEEPEKIADETEENTSIEEEQIHAESEEEDEDQPMWRSFLERDDIETDSGYEYEDDSVEVDEFEEDEDDGFIEEPIYDLTNDETDHDEKVKKIAEWLNDEKDRFVEEIFMGSEFAYEQALADITDFKNWKAASMYLEREIFSRNKIDVYDEEAVDFTDRLHNYFIENNSKHDD